jgi:hypothetical protein
MNRKAPSPPIAAIVIALAYGIGLTSAGAQDRTAQFFNGVLVPMPIAEVAINADVGFFYERLAPYGDWVENPPWGWVWIPRGMPVDWRPYTLGHWVFTDDYGWLWDSDLPWGWACMHYGRWGWSNDFGWFWVPGFTWGPAWVAWRVGPNFVGWCPLPPEVHWQPDVGLQFYGTNLNDIPAPLWVFVEIRFFDAPRLREHVLLPARNVTLFRESRNVTRFRSRNGRVVNASVSARQIEESTHRPVERFHLRHVDSAAALRLPRERDGEIAVFTPQVHPGPAGVVPPRAGEVERRQQAERAQLQEQQRAEQARQEQRRQAEHAQPPGQQRAEQARQEQRRQAEHAQPPGQQRAEQAPQEQRRQAEHATPGAGTEQLQRRQEAERQAQQSEQARQRQTLENRQARERQESAGPPAGAHKPGTAGGSARTPAPGEHEPHH